MVALEQWFYMSMANFLLDYASRQDNAYITILGDIQDECNSNVAVQDVYKMVSLLTKNITTRWLRSPYSPRHKKCKSEVINSAKIASSC